MAPDRHVSERRRFVKLLGIGTGVSAGLPVAAAAEDTGSKETADDHLLEDDGLETIKRTTDFETTTARIEAAIEDSDLQLLETIDHAENAATLGLELPPTTLFLFGTPEVGTPLMQAGRSIAIDLPQKLLIWEADGDVFVTYNHPQRLATRHEVADIDPDVLEGIDTTLAELARA